ncbi:MAG: nitrate- and nitrite sensing domain-containing protein, partial [Gammaproteobacteria bacterium]
MKIAFLDKLTLRSKTAAIVLAPLICVAFFAVPNTQQTLSEYQQTSALTELTMLLRGASDVVHEIQKERGMSAGLLSSDGENFSAKLANQRRQTDKAVTELTSNVKQGLGEGLSSESKQMLDAAISQLTNLDALRASVDGKALKPREAVLRYSAIIGGLSEIPHEVIEAANSNILRAMTEGYHLIFEGKEDAGLERALATQIFALGAFNADLALAHAKAVQSADEHLRGAVDILPSALGTSVEQLLRGTEHQAVLDLNTRIHTIKERVLKTGELHKRLGYGG